MVPILPWRRPALRSTLVSGLCLACAGCRVAGPLPPASAEPPRPLASGWVAEAPPTPFSHAATLAEPRPGWLAAAWMGEQGVVGEAKKIWLALGEVGADGTTRWQAPRPVAEGHGPDGRPAPAWNPVLFQPRGGPLLLFYKVGPDPDAWEGCVTASEDGGRTWGAPRPLPAGVVGPAKNKPIERADGTWLAGSSREDGAAGRRLQFLRSTDRGATWQVHVPPGAGRDMDAIQPALLSLNDGRVLALCRTHGGAIAATESADGGRSWSRPRATLLPNPNAGLDALTLADGRHLLVYNHSGRRFAGVGWGERWPLDVAVSADGAHWRRLLTLEPGPDDSGYAYPALIQAADGRVHIVYSWRRQRLRHVVLDPARW